MRTSLLRSLRAIRNKRSREALIDAHLRNGIAFQIRAMRRERNWTQDDLAGQSEMKPTQITRVENPGYGSHTLTTLKRIAAAFDVALVVRFVPFSELLEWDSGRRNMAPASFGEELESASGESHLQIADGD